jgi:hypothetical protein
VSLVAAEDLRIKVKLAGGNPPANRRSKKGGEDNYGKLLEERERQKELHKKFSKGISKYLNKPL